VGGPAGGTVVTVVGGEVTGTTAVAFVGDVFDGLVLSVVGSSGARVVVVEGMAADLARLVIWALSTFDDQVHKSDDFLVIIDVVCFPCDPDEVAKTGDAEVDAEGHRLKTPIEIKIENRIVKVSFLNIRGLHISAY
jgi:hypothetical protein